MAFTQALDELGQQLEHADPTVLVEPGDVVRSAFLDYMAVVVAYPSLQ